MQIDGGAAEIVDQELEIAIELSRRTFMDEKAKREAEEGQKTSDLMVVEDPAVLERNRQIEQIKEMFRASANPSNPFLPSNTNFPPPRPPGPIFGQSNIMGQGQGALCPNFAYFNSSQPFCLPSTSSSSSTTGTSSQHHFESTFPPPPPTPVPSFSSSNIGHFLAPSTSSSFHPSNNSALPLAIQTNLNPFKLSTNLAASPLKVPFRHGDLIDLNSPRNVRSMALEEFDPLYKKLQKMKNNQEEEMENVTSEKNERNSKIEEEIGQKQMDKNEKNSQSTPSENEATKGGNEEKPKARPRKMRPNGGQQRMLNCADLKAVKELTCDFYKEKQLLSEQSSRLAIPMAGKKNVFFLSPVLDYFVTRIWTTALRTKFHIVEPCEFWQDCYKCNCYEGARKKACEHAVMWMCSDGLAEYPPEVTAELIEKKRKRGRPKKVHGGTALMHN